MGEVIGGIVLLLFVGGVVAFAFYIMHEVRPTRDNAEPNYKNHLAMSRWIERQLNDDMVSCVISEPDEKLAHKLLTEFYKEN